MGTEGQKELFSGVLLFSVQLGWAAGHEPDLAQALVRSHLALGVPRRAESRAGGGGLGPADRQPWGPLGHFTWGQIFKTGETSASCKVNAWVFPAWT